MSALSRLASLRFNVTANLQTTAEISEEALDRLPGSDRERGERHDGPRWWVHILHKCHILQESTDRLLV